MAAEPRVVAVVTQPPPGAVGSGGMPGGCASGPGAVASWARRRTLPGRTPAYAAVATPTAVRAAAAAAATFTDSNEENNLDLLQLIHDRNSPERDRDARREAQLRRAGWPYLVPRKQGLQGHVRGRSALLIRGRCPAASRPR